MKVPPPLPRFVGLPDNERFVLLEQVISAKLDLLFPGMEILAHHPFRVTRDADFELEDEAEDLLEAMETVLRRRNKFGRVVRLEVDTKMSNEVLELLSRELEIPAADVTVIDGPLDLAGLWTLYAVNRPELKDDPWVPQTQVLLSGSDPAPDFFRLLKTTDVLVHHPYDSFATSVEQFVEQAAGRPERARDQADHLPHRRAGEHHRALADQGGRTGQAGRRAGGAQRRASTSRPTSNVPTCSRKPACTSSTGSSG